MDSERARIVFYASLSVIGTIAFWLYASSPDERGRARWRSWRLWNGLAALFDAGNERRPLVRFVRAAGEDMSSYEVPQVVRDTPEPAEPMAVRADADAERTSSESISEPAREPSTLQNRDALILQLAQMKYPDGKYCLSANAICGAVGGTAADVKAKIAAVRGTGSPAPRAMQKGERLVRPEGGW